MKPPTLLLVDDDAVFRRVMAGELGRIGYDVDTVGTGEEAIQLVASMEPDFVLLDLRLPGMGGLETLKALQAAAPTTEVIMLTGHGSIDSAIESVRIGPGDSFVGDSPEFRRLLNLIDRVAPSDSTVLITVETGTGKEKVAKLIHARS